MLNKGSKTCSIFKSAFILVSADTDGYLNFYAVDGVMKNTILCRKRILNEAEQIAAPAEKFNKVDLGIQYDTAVYFPIKALDFDPEEQMVWTGDDVGYMAKWDVSVLIHKVIETEKRHLKEEKNKKSNTPKANSKATFITGTGSEG